MGGGSERVSAPGGAGVLAWFEPRRRLFPWRATRDPYRVFVSEVMLQQTQASRVVPAYRAFLARFPTVGALGTASRRDVLVAWDDLGYNRRAVALSEAARRIVREHRARVPREPRALQRLPGVGPYTAAAIASIAFGVPVAAVDTNVRRIVARVFEGAEGDDVAPRRIRELADAWLDPADPGAWNQALMDLGREICRPRPRCDACPLTATCRFLALGREPRPSRRSQGVFDGSSRQVRGAVVRVLRTRAAATAEELAHVTGFEIARVTQAVSGLVADGALVYRRGRAALAE
jgi:A/G-specific adenine glycosylase